MASRNGGRRKLRGKSSTTGRQGGLATVTAELSINHTRHVLTVAADVFTREDGGMQMALDGKK